MRFWLDGVPRSWLDGVPWNWLDGVPSGWTVYLATFGWENDTTMKDSLKMPKFHHLFERLAN